MEEQEVIESLRAELGRLKIAHQEELKMLRTQLESASIKKQKYDSAMEKQGFLEGIVEHYKYLLESYRESQD